MELSTAMLTDSQQLVAATLDQLGPRTVGELSRVLGWMDTVTYRILRQLERKQRTDRITVAGQALWWATTPTTQPN